MRRLIALLAATAALMILPLSPALANNPVPYGGENNGSYIDNDYLDNRHNINGDWMRASLSNSGHGEIDAFIYPNDLPDYNGDKTCLQVAFDWKRIGGHYDSRVFRTCQPNYSWNPSKFIEPGNACNLFGPDGKAVYVPCNMAMKRVQFAKFVPATGALLGEECRDFGSNACAGWEPRCGFQDTNPTYCYVVWRHRDGTTDKYGTVTGTSVVDPDS